MKDWRGTEIRVGDTVIYGAGVERSISPVVAEVLELRPSEDQKQNKAWSEDKVKLRVLEYAFGYRSNDKRSVFVMPERVTVVTELPKRA